MRGGWSALLVVASLSACGGSSGIVLAIESEVVPLDRVTLSLLGDEGALVADQQVGDMPVALPLRVRIDPAGRRERVRALGWGWVGAERRAFGQVAFDVAPDADREATLLLEAFGTDADEDLVPDRADDCPHLPDAGQADPSCSAWCPGNLLGNPDFEQAPEPWRPEHAVHELTAMGLPGQGLEVCWDESEADYAAKVDVDITGAAADTVYRLDAWVQVLSPADFEQTMQIDLKEFNGSTLLTTGTTTQAFAPTGSYVLFSGLSDPITAGSTHLEVQIESDDVDTSPAPPYCFRIDSLCLEAMAP